MFVSNQFGSCEYNIGEQEYSMDSSGNLLIIQRKANNQLNQYFYLEVLFIKLYMREFCFGIVSCWIHNFPKINQLNEESLIKNGHIVNKE